MGTRFKPYSKFPPCYKDVAFWVSDEFTENNMCEVVRGVAGDLVEEVKLIDDFTHPKTVWGWVVGGVGGILCFVHAQGYKHISQIVATHMHTTHCLVLVFLFPPTVAIISLTSNPLSNITPHRVAPPTAFG